MRLRRLVVHGLVLNGIPRPWRVFCCDTFLQRARGLAGSSASERRLVWRLRPCSAVHTLFPGGPIDVVFCDPLGRVLHVVAPLPARRCAGKRGADSAWEFPAGVVGQLQLGCGDRLTLCE